MNRMRLLSWNVNGIRAVLKKGFVEWFWREKPDILCIQETKAQEEQISDIIRKAEGYYTYFASAERRGYSGVGFLTRQKPKHVQKGLGIEKFDREGRVIIADHDEFSILNIYFPNGKISRERLRYKMAFYDAFLKYVVSLNNKGQRLIICGDVNTAHTEIDLARPKENAKVSGFLPEERAWIDKFLSHGFIDTFRLFNKEGGNYTWWDLKTRARERNVGWRIDYFYVSSHLRSRLSSAFILSGVMGSDHCPIGIEINV